jgi:sortase A
MSVAATLRRLQFVFGCAGILLLGWCTGAFVQARYHQAMDDRRLEEARLHKTPDIVPARPKRAVREPGSLVGRLEIPRLKLKAIVLEGSDHRTLSRGVGLIPQTAEPGETGNVVLGGHRDTFFRPLRGIRAGDRIRMVTPGASYSYQVDWTAVVNPSDNSTLKATPRKSLTLVTCYPFRYIGPAPQRFVVRAHQLPQGVVNTVSY